VPGCTTDTQIAHALRSGSLLGSGRDRFVVADGFGLDRDLEPASAEQRTERMRRCLDADLS
tara:strand:- start:98112 stop:98294 length:183 start_codon:yes stop_codon:yes gene_type:complete